MNISTNKIIITTTNGTTTTLNTDWNYINSTLVCLQCGHAIVVSSFLGKSAKYFCSDKCWDLYNTTPEIE